MRKACNASTLNAVNAFLQAAGQNSGNAGNERLQFPHPVTGSDHDHDRER